MSGRQAEDNYNTNARQLQDECKMSGKTEVKNLETYTIDKGQTESLEKVKIIGTQAGNNQEVTADKIVDERKTTANKRGEKDLDREKDFY